MTPDQIIRVRASWQQVANAPDALTRCFYTHLFEIDASAARLFAGVDMAAQRKKLTQTLTVVVNSLDDTDRLLPAIVALGKRHAHYGIEDHQFDSVGDALLWALADVLEADLTIELREAWAAAYALVASVMRRALRPIPSSAAPPVI